MRVSRRRVFAVALAALVAAVIVAAVLILRYTVGKEDELPSRAVPWTDAKDLDYHGTGLIDGNRLVLSPSGASLAIPSEWMERYSRKQDNLFVGSTALDEIITGKGE